MIYDVDGVPVDYRFLEANPSFTHQTGLKNATGKTIRELAPGHEQHWFQMYHQILTTGTPARFEQRAQALRRWYDVYAFRLGGDGTRKVAVLFNDITARKQTQIDLNHAKSELESANANLELKVAERTAELRELVGELETFSYSVSHDMRAPLRAMQGYSAMLLEEHGSALGPDGASLLRKISTAALRLDKLITDILTYSRVVRAELRLQPVETDNLIRDLIEQYPEWHPPQAEVRVTGALPKVLANESLLIQCVTNLIANAVKFVAPGTVPQVRIWSEPVGRNGERSAKILFQDNGIGIERQSQSRIFGMFERLHGSEYPGTGIGLSIVRKAIDRMGGQFGLESAPGHGSTFWIQLPSAK